MDFLAAFPDVWLLGMATCVAACLGSFFNVVAWRLPRGMSLAFPPSHCPGCGTSIPWYRNIPVATWLLQRGRCARCGCGIPVRYVLVEAFCALLGLGWAALALSHHWQDPGISAGWIVFALAGVPIALIDWDTFEIPDGLVVVAGLGGASARMLFSDSSFLAIVRDGLLACGALYALSFSSRVFLGWLGSGARRILRNTRPRRSGAMRPLVRLLLRWAGFDGDVEALGLGDVSLGLAAGASLGVPAVVVGLPLAAVFGLIGHVFAAGARSRAKSVGLDEFSIPFGPFLVLGFLAGSLLLGWSPSALGEFLPFP